MKTRLTSITMLILLALATTAVAQGPYGRHTRSDFPSRVPGFESRLGHLDVLLDLTEEQEAAIEAIGDKAREQGVELRKQLARLQNEIDGELLADTPSEKTLIDLTRKLGAVRTELQVIRLQTRLAVRAELTAEQRDKLVLMTDRGGRHGRHYGQAPRVKENRFRFYQHQMLDDQDDDDDDDI